MKPETLKLVTIVSVLLLGVGGALGAFALGAGDLSYAVLALAGGILSPSPAS